MNDTENQILDLVRKALSVESTTGTSIQPFIKEDLEDEAYVQLYSETDPAQMSLLKDIPRQQAEQINHEFAQVDRYGNHKTKASFSPNALPPEANIEGVKKNVNLKVYGKTSAVQGLTVLQNTIRAMGQSDIASSNDMAVKLLMQYQINAALYCEDTRDTLDSNIFKGIWQQIDEATKSPSATTPWSNTDIFIDLGGQPLLPDGRKGIRSQAVGFTKRNGSMRRIYFAPECLETIENNLDPAARIQIGASNVNNTKGVIIGNSVDGMRVQGNIVYFRRDAALSSVVRTGEPNFRAIPGAPAAFTFGGAGAGTITQPAENGAATTGKWRSGERLTGLVYIVTAVNEVGESIASIVSNPVDVTDREHTVEFTITPRGDELSFRIYRGYAVDAAQPGTFLEPVARDPQFIFEIPNGNALGNTTPITVVDDDQYMAGTTVAWGTDLWSPNAAAIDEGRTPTSATNDYTVGRSAVAMAQLTGLFEFDLAKLGWLYSNKLFAHVLSPQVPRPWVNVVWYNVGGVEMKTPLLDRPN